MVPASAVSKLFLTQCAFHCLKQQSLDLGEGGRSQGKNMMSVFNLQKKFFFFFYLLSFPKGIFGTEIKGRQKPKFIVFSSQSPLFLFFSLQLIFEGWLEIFGHFPPGEGGDSGPFSFSQENSEQNQEVSTSKIYTHVYTYTYSVSCLIKSTPNVSSTPSFTSQKFSGAIILLHQRVGIGGERGSWKT